MCFFLSFPPDFEGDKLSPWPFFKGTTSISVRDWRNGAAWLKPWVTMHFSEIIKLQFEKECHMWLCILKLFENIVNELSLKNA